jgi:hypothetical protein
MTSAFDDFERALVRASSELSDRRLPTTAPEPQETVQGLTGWRRLRALGRASKLGIALTTVGLGGGIAFAATQLIPGSSSYHLAAFGCGPNPSVGFSVGAVTGSPLIDCSVAWPQMTRGHRVPPLQVWAKDSGREATAIVVPAALGNPMGNQKYSGVWTRVPDSWHIDLRLTVLNDQLGNISMPFDADHAGGCSREPEDVTAVRRVLTTDRLSGWRVVVQGQHAVGPNDVVNGAPYRRGCYATTSSVEFARHEVVLRQFLPAAQPATTITTTTTAGQADARHRQRKVSEARRAIQTAYLQLRSVYLRVNRRLSLRCESVGQASRVWVDAAAAVGFKQPAPSFWRPLRPRPDVRYFHHYLLYRQPAGQRTGTCAHVLVMGVPGDGVATVYVARVSP